MITDDQIRQLQTEAGATGDVVQVAICRCALGEDMIDVAADLEMTSQERSRFEMSEKYGWRALCEDAIADA